MPRPPAVSRFLRSVAAICVAGLTPCCGGDRVGGAGEREEADAAAAIGADGAELEAADSGSPADPALTEGVSIGLAQLPSKLDPLDDLEPWAMRIGEDLIFEGLVERGTDRYPWVQPAIADSCEVDREYAVATIYCHIPRGVRFHDGSELEVTDVVYSLSYWLDKRRSWIRQRHGLTNFEQVSVVDGPHGAEQRDPGRWVQIGLSKREPLALEALAAIKIVPKRAHMGRESQFAEAPIGTGPMRVSLIARDRLVVERFADYRDPEAASAAAKIVFRALDDGAEALTALRRGEIHLLPEVAPVHLPVELGKPGMSGRFVGWLVSPSDYDLLLWNVAAGPASRRRTELGLRSALHDALPLSAITREVYGAAGLSIGAPVDLHDPVALDLEALEELKAGEPVRGGLLALPRLEDDVSATMAAAAALDALGWVPVDGRRAREGSSLRVTLTWDGRDGRPTATAALIEASWEALGATIPEASASWNYLLTLLRKGEFDVALVHLGARSDEDLYELFHSRGAMNFSGVSDLELDRALADYRGASDRSGREAAKDRVAARLAALRVVSMIHAPTAVMLASRRLTGVSFVDDIPRLDRLALSAGDVDWAQASGH